MTDSLRRLHWDCAAAFGDPILTLLRSVCGLDNVVYGSDYPYPADSITIGARRLIASTEALSDAERAELFGGAATRLVPRLGERVTR